jgi:hypothetical protein
MLSVLFPSVFNMVRVVPAADFVVVLVIEPAGFVTVRVIGVPVMDELEPIALPIGIGAPPPPLFRCAAKGIQTSNPSATIGRIRLRIEGLILLTSLGPERVKEMVANRVPISGSQPLDAD